MWLTLGKKAAINALIKGGRCMTTRSIYSTFLTTRTSRICLTSSISYPVCTDYFFRDNPVERVNSVPNVLRPPRAAGWLQSIVDILVALRGFPFGRKYEMFRVRAFLWEVCNAREVNIICSYNGRWQIKTFRHVNIKIYTMKKIYACKHVFGE